MGAWSLQGSKSWPKNACRCYGLLIIWRFWFDVNDMDVDDKTLRSLDQSANLRSDFKLPSVSVDFLGFCCFRRPMVLEQSQILILEYKKSFFYKKTTLFVFTLRQKTSQKVTIICGTFETFGLTLESRMILALFYEPMSYDGFSNLNSLSLSLTHTHTHTHKHIPNTHTHTRTKHTHTHTPQHWHAHTYTRLSIFRHIVIQRRMERQWAGYE